MDYTDKTYKMVDAKIKQSLREIKKLKRTTELSRKLAVLDSTKPKSFANAIDAIIDWYSEQYYARAKAMFDLIENILLIEPVTNYKHIEDEDERGKGFLDGELTFYRKALAHLKEYRNELLGGEWK